MGRMGWVFSRQPAHGKGHPHTWGVPSCLALLHVGCTSLALPRGPPALGLSLQREAAGWVLSPNPPKAANPKGVLHQILWDLHQCSLPGGMELGAVGCQGREAHPTWIHAISHAMLALGEAANAPSKPQQGLGGTTLFPVGFHWGWFPHSQAAKLPWSMFPPVCACMGSSTYLGMGREGAHSICHLNQCVTGCLCPSLLGTSTHPTPWTLTRVLGLPPPTKRPFPLFIVPLRSALASESNPWGWLHPSGCGWVGGRVELPPCDFFGVKLMGSVVLLL